MAVASLGTKHRLQGAKASAVAVQTQSMHCTGSVFVSHCLSCSVASGIFSDQGSVTGRFFTNEPLGKSSNAFKRKDVDI